MATSTTRRGLVMTSLPLAALAAASTKVFAASVSPDAELLRLGKAHATAWARQAEAEAKLNVASLDDDAWDRFDVLNDEAGAIVKKIEALQATTLAGLIVKARACHWCHGGEPIDEAFFDDRPTTDSRLAAGILGDLVAMGGRTDA